MSAMVTNDVTYTQRWSCDKDCLLVAVLFFLLHCLQNLNRIMTKYKILYQNLKGSLRSHGVTEKVEKCHMYLDDSHHCHYTLL